jgi:hypothetical protein
VVLLLVGTLEINASSYPEKYLVASYEKRLFKVLEKDSITECFLLSSDLTPEDSGKTILIGIKFNLLYVNTDYNHFWDNQQLPNGWYGNLDTIRVFEIKSANRDISYDLLQASEYKYFSLLNGVLYNHSGKPVSNKSRTCYSSQTPLSLNDFIRKYNYADSGSTIPGLSDYHFFLVPDSLNKLIIVNGVDFTLINSDNDTISEL